MKKTCRTCKHCLLETRGGHKVMTCKTYSATFVVVCDPPYDEACPRYEEGNNGRGYKCKGYEIECAKMDLEEPDGQDV